MPNLHARSRLAAEDLSVVDATSADPRAGKDSHGAAGRPSRSKAILAVDSGVDVVEDDGRTAELLFEDRLDFHVFPAEVWGVEDGAFVQIERACAPQANPPEVPLFETRLRECLGNCFHDAGDTALSSLMPFGLASFSGDHGEV